MKIRIILAAALVLVACRKNDRTCTTPAQPATEMTPEASKMILTINDTKVEATNIGTETGIAIHDWETDPPGRSAIFGDIKYNDTPYHFGIIFEPPYPRHKPVGFREVYAMYLMSYTDSVFHHSYNPYFEITADDRKTVEGKFSGTMRRYIHFTRDSMGYRIPAVQIDSSIDIRGAEFKIRW